MDEGYSPLKAARYGVGEVAWPIIASTGTTLAAFLPGALARTDWRVHELLADDVDHRLGIVAVCGAGHQSRFDLGLHESGRGEVSTAVEPTWCLPSSSGVGLAFLAFGATGLGNIFIAGTLTLLNTYVFYPATLGVPKCVLAPSRRLCTSVSCPTSSVASALGRFFWGTVGLLFLSIVLMGVFPPKVLFFPDNQPQYLNIFVSKPIGTDLSETNKVAKDIEVRDGGSGARRIQAPQP